MAMGRLSHAPYWWAVAAPCISQSGQQASCTSAEHEDLFRLGVENTEEDAPEWGLTIKPSSCQPGLETEPRGFSSWQASALMLPCDPNIIQFCLLPVPPPKVATDTTLWIPREWGNINLLHNWGHLKWYFIAKHFDHSSFHKVFRKLSSVHHGQTFYGI